MNWYEPILGSVYYRDFNTDAFPEAIFTLLSFLHSFLCQFIHFMDCCKILYWLFVTHFIIINHESDEGTIFLNMVMCSGRITSIYLRYVLISNILWLSSISS